MSIFQGAAWAAFALAVISIIMGIGSEFPPLIGAGFAVAFVGVFFLGMDRIIVLLVQIAHPRGNEASTVIGPSHPADPSEAELGYLHQTGHTSGGDTITRSAAEISADLRKMREGLASSTGTNA